MLSKDIFFIGGHNYFKAVGEGFKDMTRIASSPYRIWEDICETN